MKLTVNEKGNTRQSTYEQAMKNIDKLKKFSTDIITLCDGIKSVAGNVASTPEYMGQFVKDAYEHNDEEFFWYLERFTHDIEYYIQCLESLFDEKDNIKNKEVSISRYINTYYK